MIAGFDDSTFEIVVAGRVIGDDQHAVLRREILGCQRLAGHPQIVLAHLRQAGNVGIVVRELGAQLQQLFGCGF